MAGGQILLRGRDLLAISEREMRDLEQIHDVVASGTDSYSFLSTVGDIGQNRVRACVSDGQPSTPDGLAEWIVMVADVPIGEIAPAGLDFGLLLVGEPATALAIDLTNTGTVDWEVTAPAAQEEPGLTMSTSPGWIMFPIRHGR